MRMFVAGRWLAVSCLALLAACGGGGGGGGGGASMTFSPTTVSDTVQQGESGTITDTVTVGNPGAITGDVWVTVIDSQEVLANGLNVSEIDDAHFAVTMYSAPGLSVGHHRGSFEVHLCKDQACTQEWIPSTTLPYDIDVEVAPLHAVPTTSTDSTVPSKGVDNDVVQLSVTGGTQWSVVTGAPWLVVNPPVTGTSPGTVSLGFASTQLAVGDYSTTATVSSDGQSVAVPVTLHVVPPQFVIDAGGSPVFAAVNGTTIAPQPFSFELDNGTASPWSLSSDSPWLGASATSGVTPASLMLSADPSIGSLAAGNYSGNLTLSSPGSTDKQVTAQLQLIKPTLTTAVPSITLGGTRGRDPLSTQSVLLTLNTGSNTHPFSTSALPDWLSITPSGAMVGQPGTSLTVGVNASAVTPGSQSAAVVLTSVVNGDTVTAPLTVNINVDQRRLLPSSWGVAFASTPNGTLTTRTLQVTDNYGGTLAWTAVSDAGWLSVTPSGTTGGTSSLTLTADPTQVPSDQVSYANVRIASATPGVAANTVRVAIWKSAVGLSGVTSLAGNASTELVADKIRPYVYANSHGTSITVYNAYTAAPVATISNVGQALGQMTVSPDGSKLYAIDTSSQSLKVVDLATQASIDSWALSRPADAGTSLVAVRPDGYEVVIVGNGTAYAAGNALPPPGIYGFGHMSATDDGSRLYTIDTGGSPASQTAWSLDHSDIAGGVLYATSVGAPFFVGNESNGRDIAVAPDGSAVYTASGAPYVCVALNPADLSFVKDLPGGDAYPNNVEVTWSNRAICGIEGYYSTYDFWVYTPAGAIASSYKVAGYAKVLLSHEMVVTPDGFVVVVPTDDPLLAFVPIGS